MTAFADARFAGKTLNAIEPSAASLRVLEILERAGFEAWIVGGWVRDALMGVTGHDIDVCCSAPWDRSAAAIRAAGIPVVESGVKFGGITAVCGDERIEVTTYRLDGFYTDGRHPESVEYASCVEEDLARRDFTVNAMAWHPERGLLDLYDGRGDLDRRLIRAVGDPVRRFDEDALRMLRAVRFACRLDFRIEDATARALAEAAEKIDAVAAERIGAELCGILATGHGGDALLNHPELMCAVVPELAPMRGFDQRSVYHAFDVYDHTARVLTVAGELARFRIDGGDPDQPPSLSLMWAALLHDVGKPQTFTVDEAGCGHFHGHPSRSADMASRIMRRLALSTDLIRDAVLLVRYHDMPLEASRESLLRMMRLLSVGGVHVERLMGELLDLKRADTLGKAPRCFSYVEEIERMREIARELTANREPYSLKMLAVKGGDLIGAGVDPGPQIGAMLDRALDAVISGEVENSRGELLDFLGLLS